MLLKEPKFIFFIDLYFLKISLFNLFVDLDKISELIESINTDERILSKKKRDIQTIYCNFYTEEKITIIVPKNKENVLNKERKNILIYMNFLKIIMNLME